jgi:hypothetical protein
VAGAGGRREILERDLAELNGRPAAPKTRIEDSEQRLGQQRAFPSAAAAPAAPREKA